MAKLLVVDDSFAVRRLVINALRMAGIVFSQIKEANDGLEALQAVSADLPDLVICDMNMPKLDGLKFVKAFRQKYPGAATRLVMLTARGSQPIEAAAKLAGVDLFLAKPFVPEEMVARLLPLMPRED